MNEKRDILDDLRLRENPYSVRDGYLDYIESRVNDRIDNPAKASKVWPVLKPALLLACSFILIFGIGYGTLSLTNTLNSNESSSITASEESFDSFMENLHNTNSDTFNENGDITEEEMFEFVTEYYSTQYIESYFASAE